MPSHDVTLHLPDRLYEQIKQRAAQARRTVEDEMLDVLAGIVPTADDLPPDLAEAISPLATLPDDDLWRAARSHLARESAEELARLNDKRQREDLTTAEAEAAALLVRGYERAMLVRAEAAALLKQRGHDVSVLLTAA